MNQQDWAREQLLERRTVFVRGTLDEQAAGDAAATLMTLDATGDSPVTLYVDASGTSLDAAFTLMDVIDLMGVPVHAMCVGRVEGPAVGVVAAASRRTAAPHTRFRLCQPRVDVHGSASDLARWAQHHQDRMTRFEHRLATAVGKPVAEVAADCQRGIYLDAHEAVRYGLVDEVASRGATIHPWPDRPFGFRPR